jgi:hypothetical protein
VQGTEAAADGRAEWHGRSLIGGRQTRKPVSTAIMMTAQALSIVMLATPMSAFTSSGHSLHWLSSESRGMSLSLLK